MVKSLIGWVLAFFSIMLSPLNGLRAFEAVSRHLTIVGAANELHVTPSAVSHQIKNLEKFFGVELVKKTKQGLSLTYEGELLCQNLGTAFKLIDEAVSNVVSVTASSSIGLSTTSQFAARWLTPRLPRFWRLRPKFTLEFFHTTKEPDFSNSRLSLAILWLHKSEAGKDDQLLFDGCLTPACAATVLKGDSPKMAPQMLINHSLLEGDDKSLWPEWLTAAGVPGLAPKFYEFYEDASVRFQAMMAGEGFALICPSLFEEELKNGTIVCPFSTSLEGYGFFLRSPSARKTNANLTFLTRWLIREARQ